MGKLLAHWVREASGKVGYGQDEGLGGHRRHLRLRDPCCVEACLPGHPDGDLVLKAGQAAGGRRDIHGTGLFQPGEDSIGLGEN